MTALQTIVLSFLGCLTGPQDLSVPGYCVERTVTYSAFGDSLGNERMSAWNEQARWVCLAPPQCLYFDTDKDGDVDLADWAEWTNRWSLYPDRQSLLDRIEQLEEEVARQEQVIFWLLNR